ncbi:phosphopyruvate hydratase [Candidatus Bodocaedibacter vickermanii]|uniref:Enolase n=1 Tax=Candidatus Bodocaedibacter vickermanii TaxID=2741701 RepID=A0A7L9RUY5_9PROT|nr:Enolase [Candidatus Paracaedibacteraceae bacterium 'Lake Konstanz']
MKYLMIADYTFRQILDSRGNPTIEAEITLEDETKATAAVPSGASTGAHEAVEKRDQDINRYVGKGVESVIEHANEILSDEIIGFNVFDQRGLDQLLNSLDGTEQKANLGANVTLAISLAAAKAAARSLKLPLYRYLGGTNAARLPVPMMNILNGGAHADNGLDIQEFMVMPVGAPSFYEGLRWGTEIYHHLKTVLKSQKLSTNVGDEGGFAPNIQTTTEALDLVTLAVEKAGYKAGHDIVFALDVAATELYRDGFYHIEGQRIDGSQLVSYYQNLCNRYPIASIEDGCAEDDWTSWIELTRTLGASTQIVGDDLFVTNPKRIAQGIQQKAANALLVKPNQIGTLTETIDAITLAQTNGFKTIISHRSGETDDTTIADIAVAFNTGQIKTGAPCRTDRVAKYNQLLRIEEELGDTSLYIRPF